MSSVTSSVHKTAKFHHSPIHRSFDTRERSQLIKFEQIRFSEKLNSALSKHIVVLYSYHGTVIPAISCCCPNTRQTYHALTTILSHTWSEKSLNYPNWLTITFIIYSVTLQSGVHLLRIKQWMKKEKKKTRMEINFRKLNLYLQT